MDSIFAELAIILSLACICGLLTLRMKLPVVVAYLLAGVLLSALYAGDASVLHGLPEIGIAFVLFLVGMELNFDEIRSLGLPIVFAAIIQIALSSVAGFFIAGYFGIGGVEGALLGLALAFSSTVVIIKTLVEKRDLASLYGKLSVGLLLMEDLVAILAMTAVSTGLLDAGLLLSDMTPVFTFLGKALVLIAFAYLSANLILNRLFDLFARSTELLFLAAVAWCFILTALAVLAGFSVVIGAFIAGIALATSPYHIQIQGKIKPLRDFFVALFFVYVGAQVEIQHLKEAWPMVVALAGFALFIKPIIYLMALSVFRLRKHTLFQTALNMTQISEFSLIVLLLGAEFGLVSPLVLSVVAASAVLSMMISSVMIANSDRIYGTLKPVLKLMPHRTDATEIAHKEKTDTPSNHVVVIGADRVGHMIVEHLKSANIPLIVLDYNPKVVRRLRKEGVRTIYGDVSDPEVLEHLYLDTAKLVISTASGLVDNTTLLEAARTKKTTATLVVRAAEPEHEAVFRELGADYVMLPERVSSDFLVSKLKNEWPNVSFKGHGTV